MMIALELEPAELERFREVFDWGPAHIGGNPSSANKPRGAQTHIEPERIAQAQRMLAAGISSTAVRKKVRLGHDAVRAIAAGRWTEEGKLHEALEIGERFVSLRRCAGCGAKNYVAPCRTCKARERRKQGGEHEQDATR